MFDFKYKKHNFIYNNLVKLSRNIYFYKDIKLEDKLRKQNYYYFCTFSNYSYLFKKKQTNKDLSQELYDNIFLILKIV